MNLIAWPILLPLVAGAVLILVPRPRARTAVSVSASLSVLAVSLAIGVRAFGGEVLVAQMADWPAPFGISLVADRLAAMMLVLSSATGLLTVLFAGSSLQHPPRRGQGPLLNRAREAFGAQSLLQFLFMGVNMSLLSGDLFNLFVAFEVMLVASYGLLLLGGELSQLREGFKYVVVNLIASAIFVIAAGLAYGLFGSLNMADIAVRLAEHGPDQRITLVALLLALVFAIKAALFPFGFWLPDSYPVPPAATSAFFAGLLTKVGAYALIRSFTLMFPQEELIHTVILVLAGLTILLGGFGAIARRRWRHVLAFANIAGIGYLTMGAFAGTSASLSAALYYLAHSVLVVFALFLVAALAERIAGPDYRIEGHLARYPWLGVGYFVAAMALAGVPPTSGFVGKYSLISALIGAGGDLRLWIAGGAVVTSFLLLYAGMQIWQRFFWGESDAVHQVRLPRPMMAVTATALVLVIGLAALSGPAFEFAQKTAAQLSDGRQYIEAVLEPRGRLLEVE